MKPNSTFKKLITITYLIATFIVTAATSKGGRSFTENNDLYTNYAVFSSCPGSINDANIQVNRSVITKVKIFEDTLPLSTQEFELKSFKAFGLANDTQFIGEPSLGLGEKSTHKCEVKRTVMFPNHEYNPNQTQYFFQNPGQLTATTYECSLNGQYYCSVDFEELPAGAFTELFYKGDKRDGDGPNPGTSKRE